MKRSRDGIVAGLCVILRVLGCGTQGCAVWQVGSSPEGLAGGIIWLPGDGIAPRPGAPVSMNGTA